MGQQIRRFPYWCTGALAHWCTDLLTIGISRVEAEGYSALAELGGSRLRRVLTCGGGAENPQWMRMRESLLGVPTSRADNTDAAYGVALLAVRGG